jgi:hypothetical protein
MVKLHFRLIIVLVVSALFTACGAHTSAPASKITISVDSGSGPYRAAGLSTAPPAITSLVFTISAPDMTTISQVVSISTPTTVSVTFDVPTGNQRLFVVEAKDQGGATLYAGSTTADLDGTPKTLTIDMTQLALTAPTGVTATAGNGQVTLAWTAVSGATSYNVYWSLSSGVTPSTGTKITGASNPYIQTGLTNGVPYYYVITAVNAVGESPASAPVSATPAVSVSAPTAPTGVSATAGVGQVTLAWTPVSGATSYNVYWSIYSWVTTSAGMKIANATSPYTHSGLASGTPYYYIVTAVNSSGESAASSVVSATPTALLSVPTGVSATAGDGQVTLAWTQVSGATSYNVYWSLSSGVTTSNGTKITNVTSPYTASALTNGTTYYYIVTAVNNTGESAASSQVSATPQIPISGAPTGVSATAGAGQVTISWNSVTGAMSYNIYYSATPGVTTSNGTKITNVTSPYTASALTNGTTYYFRITAVNSSGESAASSQVSATPQIPIPAAPTGVSASAGHDQVTISWNAVAGATSYNIYYSTTSGVTPANGNKLSNVTSPYTHSALTNGTTYYYIVTAVNAAGESAASSQVSATPQVPAPAVPTGVSASPGDGKNMISWNGAAGATSYNLYWSVISGVTKANGTKITGVTSPYQHLNLTNNTTYYYVVTAVNAGGESAESLQVSATPSAGAGDGTPPVLTSVAITPTSIASPYPKTVTIKTGVTDTGSGVSSVSAYLGSPSYTSGEGAELYVSLTYNSASQLYEGTVNIQNYHESGVWKVEYIYTYDNAGNYRYYSINSPSDTTYSYYNGTVWVDSGIAIQHVTVSTTAPDSTPPVITTSVTVAPATITSGTVTITIGGVTDGGSGVSSVQAGLFSPAQLSSKSGVELFSSMTLSTSGKYEGTVSLQSNYESGDWKVGYIYTQDLAGNHRRYWIASPSDTTYSYNIAGTGWVNTSVAIPKVTVSAGSDSTPPALTLVAATIASGTVTISVEVTDTGSGVSSTGCQATLFSPSYAAGGAELPVNLTCDSTGICGGTVTLGSQDIDGVWSVGRIYVRDNSGNYRYYEIQLTHSDYVYNDGTNWVPTGILIQTVTKGPVL